VLKNFKNPFPWLPGKSHGEELRVGPMISCSTERVLGNRRNEFLKFLSEKDKSGIQELLSHVPKFVFIRQRNFYGKNRFSSPFFTSKESIHTTKGNTNNI
jgi:hypothetical protein